MYDLNDVAIFSAVVNQNGFSAAARSLGRPKSSVSRHVDRLERRLGVRLLERTTRGIRLTEVGALYFGRCRAVLAELEAAERDVDLHRSNPVGVIRVSCPTGVARHIIAAVLPRFMGLFPAVRIQLLADNRRFDLIEDRIDLAIRVRSELKDEAIIVRRLGLSRLIFVAGPDLVRDPSALKGPEDLESLPFLSQHEETESFAWSLRGPGDAVRAIAFDAVLWTSDTTVLLEAAAAGLGVALLPREVVGPAIESGRLLRLLPQWGSDDVTVHLAYPSRRGLRPAVRVFIDFLVQQVESGHWPLS